MHTADMIKSPIKIVMIASTAFIIGIAAGIVAVTVLAKKTPASDDYNGLYISARNQLQVAQKSQLEELEIGRLAGYLELAANTANFTAANTGNGALKDIAEQVKSDDMHSISQLDALR